VGHKGGKIACSCRRHRQQDLLHSAAGDGGSYKDEF